MSFATTHLEEAKAILDKIDISAVEKMADLMADTKNRGGRLFFLGVGGSAANCSHAVNDFRKIAGIESYAPTDNISELTARTNDEGWATIFVEWLKTSRLGKDDLVFVLSVGGGAWRKTSARTWSPPCNTLGPWGQKFWGFWAATGATRPRWLMPVASFPR